MSIKWTKDSYMGHTTTIEGFKVSRVICNSGRKLYWVHYFTYPHYAGCHSIMSDKMYSLARARKFIEHLKRSGTAYTLEQVQAVKADLKAIDEKHGNNYGDAWFKEHEEYCSQFESHTKKVSNE